MQIWQHREEKLLICVVGTELRMCGKSCVGRKDADGDKKERNSGGRPGKEGKAKG